ncbi:MAG: hypothetical protein IJR13_07645 [Bacteroidales bacterium]|nr:hypothetical protein [Bacteroidales bacterium]
MRKIEFRGKRKIDGEWVYGDFEYNRKRDIARIHSYDEELNYKCQTVVMSDTVGEFTGLTDMNGKDIFEGDIVRMLSRGRERIGVVRWDDVNPSFCIKTQDNDIEYDFVKCGEAEIEVVGNIHDKPELLNQPR